MSENNTFSTHGPRHLPKSAAGGGSQADDPRRQRIDADDQDPSREEELVVAYTWPQEDGWRVY